MARIQLKIWHAPLAVLSSPPPVGLAEGEVAIAIETNTFVKRPDGDENAPLITLNGDSNFIRTRCATTAGITLAGLQTIDGVFLNAGEIVLVKDQPDPRENGFYVASIGAWPRYTRADTVISLASSMAVIETGSLNGDSLWVCTVDRDAGSIGTVAIRFVKPLGSGGSVDPADITPAAIGAVALAAVATGAPTVLNTLAKIATSINNDPNVYTTLTGLMDSKIAVAVANLVGDASASANTLSELEALLTVEVNQREASDLALQASFDAFVNGDMDGGEF